MLSFAYAQPFSDASWPCDVCVCYEYMCLCMHTCILNKMLLIQSYDRYMFE